MSKAARLAQEREECMREFLAVFHATVQPIWGSRSVWDQEAARLDATPLPWPLRMHGEGFAQLMRALAAASVDTVRDAIARTRGPQAVPPEDPTDPAFQMILRVVKRACDAAEVALCARFGGSGPLPLKRELLKLARANDADRAIRSGMPRAQAFKAAGISKAAAYRALRRRPRS